MSLEDFLFVALVTILFNGVEPLRPPLNSDQQNFSSFRSCCYRGSFSLKWPKALEEVKNWFSRCHLGFSISSFSYFVPTRRPNDHHQVSIQLDYRGDVQINSQHFSDINVYGPYKCMGKQIWPCKKVKRQYRTIILAILVDLFSPIICAKIRAQGLFGSGAEDF